ncbi:MAG: DUF4268 domain-containing protein [Planctomycetaceae bacterium]|nr:DUF4268 domain-containing protein [Planctomycetaceae bacterium]
MKLGKLKQIDLREQWKHEALDFTKWLAEPENLEQLGDEIGLDIRLIQTEAGVGKFAVDILAEEETTGKKIVIENQLEATNHSHLGQLLTYAAGIEAEYIVWVVRDARDEHRQAVEWLNEHTDDRINLFLVRIELWQIGNSDPAPKFHVISRPNDWTKSIRGGTSNNAELTDTRLWQLEFWQQLQTFALTHKPPLKLRKPQAQHWQDLAIGRSDCHVAFGVLRNEGHVGVSLYIPNSKALYHTFLANKTAIESELGLGALSWQELPGKKASRIQLLKDTDLSSENRNETFSWIVNTAQRFKTTFSKNWTPLPSHDGDA